MSVGATARAVRSRPSRRESGELIPLAHLRESEREAWCELAEGATEPNPFWHPDFVLPAARALGEWDDVAILRVLEGSEWHACLPVRRRSRWHRLPLPCVSSWRHTYCLLGTPLLAPNVTPIDNAGLLERMVAGARGIAFAALEWVSAGEPLEPTSDSSRGATACFERFPRATLRRRAQSDYLAGRIKGKHRREFRRLAQALEQELGGSLELVDRADDPSALQSFLELEASGWKGREGTALACREGHADFFREMCESFSARGSLELLFLEVEGRAVAARCNLLAGDAGFCFKVAYDEQFRRFSPGRELELRQIDRFHEGDLAWMDSCAGTDSDLFNRIWPDRRELTTLIHPAPGAAGAGAARILRTASAARARRNQRRALP